MVFAGVKYSPETGPFSENEKLALRSLTTGSIVTIYGGTSWLEASNDCFRFDFYQHRRVDQGLDLNHGADWLGLTRRHHTHLYDRQILYYESNV